MYYTSNVDKTKGFKKIYQLFVSWVKPHTGKRITKQQLSHWIVGSISLAYSSKRLQAPVGLHAHSTKGMATSWALFRGLSIRDICLASKWASPQSFERFYTLDNIVPLLAHTMLSMGSCEGGGLLA